MTNLNVYEVYLKLFEKLDYEPSLSQLAKVKALVEDYGEDTTISAMSSLSEKLLKGSGEVEERVIEFFNKLDTVAYRLTLPKWVQSQWKLIGYMGAKFPGIGKDTHEVNVQNLIGVLQESSCNDERIMERKIQEACKLVYPADSYDELLNRIEHHFQF